MCLQEASTDQSPFELRHLFAIILLFNHPEKPLSLWRKFYDFFVEDKRYQARQDNAGLDVVPEKVLENAALWDLECILQQQGTSLRDYPGMPVPSKPSERRHLSEVMRQELELCRNITQAELAHNIAKLNNEQKDVFHKVTEALESGLDKDGKVFFLYAAGGCGKTFLLNLLLDFCRSQGKVAIACALTGITSLLSKGGT